jgi:hypothetical protein
MAKKRRVRVAHDAPIGVVAADKAETRIEEFAEDLGRLLGQAQNKAASWLGQRNAIADHLIGLRDTASRLLAQLGVQESGRSAPGRGTVAAARQEAGRRKGAGKKKRVMSAEARAKIAAAQRARWARQKADKR